MVNFFKLKTSQDLFYRVGIGTIDNVAIKDYASSKSNAFVSFFKNKMRRPSKTQVKDTSDEITEKYDQLVIGDDEQKLDYTLANCCHPIPGDSVFAFTTASREIKIHKKIALMQYSSKVTMLTVY